MTDRPPHTDAGPGRIDTSAEACAVACMLVSNPQGALRKDGDGWQRRVNDLIRALRDERDGAHSAMAAARAEVEAMMAAKITFAGTAEARSALEDYRELMLPYYERLRAALLPTPAAAGVSDGREG